jgi:nucleoside-diphosphate-sugar epimerase
MSERIAIIGCGYVGSALGAALVRRGHHVIGTTTSPDRAAELTALGIAPNVVEHAAVDRLHQVLCDRDVVFLTVAPRARGERYADVYLAGVRHVLSAARDTCVRRIIYTSSTRVYAQDDGSWVDETAPTEPADEDGRTLLDAERELLDGARSNTPKAIAATVVRLAGIYGPGRDSAVRIRSAAGTERGDGDVYVNLVHVDDIVMALAALLPTRHHGVLNLADDRPELRREYYDRALLAEDLPLIRWDSSRGGGPRGKRIRNGAIKRLLNLELTHPTHP